MKMSLKVLVLLFIFNALVWAQKSESSDDDDSGDKDKDKLYDEIYKLLRERKVNREKLELKKAVNKMIDETEIDKTCSDLNQSCHAFKHCCGDYQCSGLFRGTCVTCVKQGQSCYRDSQCCPGYKCKGLPLKCGV